MQWMSCQLPRNPHHLLVAGACIATVGLSVYYLIRKKRTIHWQDDEATVTQLFMYPIKSVPGLQVQSLDVSPSGVSRGAFSDRCMILLNDEERMITMRHEPKLTLVKTLMSDDEQSLTLSAPDMEDLIITPRTDRKSDEKVYNFTVWATRTEGIEVSPAASQWFSKYLNRSATLVQHLPSFQTRHGYIVTTAGVAARPEIQMWYQDASPVHLINEASVAEANHLLPEDDEAEFQVRNFRPNIVVKGPAAHQEEKWLWVRIHDVVFRKVGLCTRCAIPTIDQDKGIKINSKTETMKQFRSPENEFEQKNYNADPLFGDHLAPESSGSIAVGMSVDVAFE